MVIYDVGNVSKHSMLCCFTYRPILGHKGDLQCYNYNYRAGIIRVVFYLI